MKTIGPLIREENYLIFLYFFGQQPILSLVFFSLLVVWWKSSLKATIAFSFSLQAFSRSRISWWASCKSKIIVYNSLLASSSSLLILSHSQALPTLDYFQDPGISIELSPICRSIQYYFADALSLAVNSTICFNVTVCPYSRLLLSFSIILFWSDKLFNCFIMSLTFWSFDLTSLFLVKRCFVMTELLS